MAKNWRSSVPISLPAAPNSDVLVDFGGGFGMTLHGMVHTVTQHTIDELAYPVQGPMFQGEVPTMPVKTPSIDPSVPTTPSPPPALRPIASPLALNPGPNNG